MNRIQKKYLFDILERIDFIFQEHLNGIDTLEDFEASRTAQSAVERELQTANKFTVSRFVLFISIS